MRGSTLVLSVFVLGIVVAGCASHDDQGAQQAEAAAAKAQQAAEQAEQDAAKAQAAADKATEAADRATKAVREATVEINRVSDHIDQMLRERDAANGRRLSHVTKTSQKAAASKAATAAGSPDAVPSASAN